MPLDWFGNLLLLEVSETVFEKPHICETFIPPCENGRGLEPVAMDA
jgi:hypothetical protein